jgi:tripartite ATP-independent transporter DctM subunit
MAMLGLVWFLAPRVGAVPVPAAAWSERRRAVSSAVPAMVMPVIIIGGILSGVFTPTEAGAVAALYALLYGLVGRRHSGRSLYRNFSSAAFMTGSALVTLAGAGLFSWVLSRAGVGQAALQLLLSVTSDPQWAMLLLIAFFFALGIFLEPVPALIIVVPIMGPMVHFGIVTIMLLVLGSVTPPVGILAMVACRIAGIGYSQTFRMLLPFIGVWLAVILLVAYVPGLVLWLPRLVQGG